MKLSVLVVVFALSAHSTVSLSPEAQRMIGVKTALVQKGPLFKTIRLAAHVAYDPDLYAAQNDYIEALRQNERLKESPLAEARQSTAHMVESAKLRLKVLGLGDDQIAKLGHASDSDASLLIGNGGGKTWIYANVYEADLGNIRAGLEVEITTEVLPGKTLKGRVESVDRIVDPMTRTAKVRVAITKAPAELRPQTFVEVNVLTPLGEQIYVPLNAVLETGTEALVYVADDAGHFEPRQVTIGAYAGDKVAILTGLSQGERIVVSANFLIDSESRLKGESDKAVSKPQCPGGEQWDVGMSMCMPKVGK
jgi:Cu(I)/Ag(I) efflux system membrane fusion protein